MKKLLISMMAMLLPLAASAYDVEINGIYYNVVKKAKQATVTSGDNKYTGSVEIPATIDYDGVTCDVVAIGDHAFDNCRGLTSVTIPNSVTTIGNDAFYDCRGLTYVHISDIAAWCNISFGSNPLSYAHHLYLNGQEVKDLVIPNSVTTIGGSAFKGYRGLTSLTIPNSVTTIGSNAFCNCFGLASVTIGNSVTSIGGYAFANCSSLTSVTIPNSVTYISSGAFYRCSGLTSVTIPNSITTIGDSAFGNCSGLTSVHISDIASWCNISFSSSYSNPLYYAHHLFMNGQEITDLVIPNSVTIIKNYSFQGCSGLTSVTIPNSVTTINTQAFSSCSNLSTITIGNGINKITTKAFANCEELADVYCYAEAVPTTSSDAFENSLIEYATLHVPTASIDLYSVANIWKDFKNIVALQNGDPGTIVQGITLNSSNCSLDIGETFQLTATIIPSNATNKTVSWISSNTSIATVSSSGLVTAKSAGTTTITCTANDGSGVKATCEVTIQGESTPEPYAALSNSNTKLTFYYDGKKASRNGMDVGPFSTMEDSGWYSQRENITTVVFDASFANYTTLTSTAYWFSGCSALTTISGITYLNTSNVKDMSDMFKECSNLTSLDVSHFNTAKVIKMNRLFSGCSKLTSLDVSNFNTANVTSMTSLFYGCSTLTSLDVNNFNTSKVTHMGSMFNGCSGITSLDVSHFDTSKATHIDNMFAGCSKLTSLDVSNFNTANVTTMTALFNGCSALTSLDVSNFNTANVTSMKSLFNGCSALTSLDVSHFDTSKAKYMDNMFSGCSKLTNLDVSCFSILNVTNMDKMFYSCSSLTTIYCNDSWSCASSANMFKGCTSLKGAISYNSSKVDVNYANPTTGYFTMTEAGTKCATPTITNNNGTLTFACKTAGAVCHYEITRAGTGNSVMLPATSDYVVKVWATKAGYEDSDVATTTITMKQGDVNGDGGVTITDAVAVVNIILNGGASAPALSEPEEAVQVPE